MNGMNFEYFVELLNAQPFEPFDVHLSSGAVHAVRYPGCAALTRTRFVITEPDADRIVVCSLLHIVPDADLPNVILLAIRTNAHDLRPLHD